MLLSEIEAIKVHTFSLNLNNFTTANPLTFSYLQNAIGLHFIPDFVEVKMACIFDPVNASTGLYDVKCNFIRDNGILVAIPSLPITAANMITPVTIHSYVPANQLSFL